MEHNNNEERNSDEAGTTVERKHRSTLKSNKNEYAGSGRLDNSAQLHTDNTHIVYKIRRMNYNTN